MNCSSLKMPDMLNMSDMPGMFLLQGKQIACYNGMKIFILLFFFSFI